jgi:perosamine synthetase
MDKKLIPVFKPSSSKKELIALKSVLDSGWWGSGKKTEEFENKIATKVGMKYGVALNSCTAALHLSGKIMNFAKNAEIVIPAISFVSTAYFAKYNNYKIVFADIEEDSLNIDSNDAQSKISNNTSAILPVHYGGRACDMDALRRIANKNDLKIVEDCAHAFGGGYKNKPLGSFGDISCFSFHAVKNISTGDGGLLATNSKVIREKARELRWLGIDKSTESRTNKKSYSWEYDVIDVGYKYQLPDILAAIGLAQLERFEVLQNKRKLITKKYDDAFENLQAISTFPLKSYMQPSYHNHTLKFKDERTRNKFIEFMSKNHISCTVHYKPIYQFKIFKEQNRRSIDCPVAEKTWKRIVNIPIYPDMTKEQIDRVILKIKEFEKWQK